MAAEQLSLLERPEMAPDGMATALLLPDDLPEVREWIGASSGCIWPRAWLIRDLLAALPDDIAAPHRALLATREANQPVYALQVRALIEAVAKEA